MSLRPAFSLLALGLVLSVNAQAPEAKTKTLVGRPAQGSRAVRESVAQMMALQIVTPARPQIVKRDGDEERYPDRSRLAQAPGAIAASSYPVRLPDVGVASPLLARTPGQNGADPLPLFANSTGFRGTRGAESPFEPPDTNGDVSPTTVLFHVNGRIRSYGRDGSVGSLNVDTNVFFNSVRRAGQDVFDPRVRYDKTTGRFILVAIDGGNNNLVYIAVSNSGTISASSTFTFFTFAQGVSGRPNAFADYPTLGLDRNALYIGTNDFTSSYRSSTAYVVRKSSILGAGPVVVTGFPNVNTSGSGPGQITPQGVDNDDPASTEGYFIGNSTRFAGELGLARVIDPGGTPSLVTQIAVPVLTTTTSTRVPQSGNGNGLDTVGDRLFLAKICYNQNSNTRTLWTSHNFLVNTSGVASSSGGRVGSRWYQIQNFQTGGTPSLVQAGTVYDPAATTPKGFFIPSVVQSLQGHALLGSSVSSAAMFGSTTSSYRLLSDPTGTMTQDLRAKDGTSSYGGTRWGDYSMATVDPADGMSFWSFQEYAEGNDWAVWTQKVLAPAPIASSGTYSARRGQSPVIGITGTGFFDPPATYPNHIGVTIAGTGVTLTPAYVSPTLVNTTFAVGADATIGSRTVIVTNPDGQTTTTTFSVLPILISGVVTFGDFTATTKPAVTVEILNGAGTVLETLSVTPANDGTISFEPTVPAGTYTLRFRSPRFLRRALTGVNVTGGTATVAPSLVNGDVDGDNAVLASDAVLVRQAFGSTSGSANWNPNADLDGDGAVLASDAVIVRRNFGRQGD